MSILYNGKCVAPIVAKYDPTDFSEVTARPEFVLKGKKFHDVTGQLKTGTATFQINGESGGGDSLEGVFDNTATEINLPTITALRSYAFYYSAAPIEKINAPCLLQIGASAFSNASKLCITELPNTIKTIGKSAFLGCSKLALTSIPAGVETIQQSAFGACLALTSITFKGTPSSIHSAAFSSCTNLTKINVPWAEGAVANAPWGATNATINYNYTEG